MLLQKITLSILIVPALFFIALLVVLPFHDWKEASGVDRLVGFGFSGFFLLLGCFLLYILFRRRKPEPQGSFNPLSASMIEISAVVIWLVILMVVMWKSASVGSDGQVSFGSGPQKIIFTGGFIITLIWVIRVLIKGRNSV